MDKSTLVTKTFIKQVEGLLNSGVAAKYSEIADAIEWDRTSMTSVLKGRRNVPVAVYRKFTEHYNLLAPEFDGQDEAENALIREQLTKDAFIESLKDSNTLFKNEINSRQRQIELFVRTNQAMLKAMIQQVVKIRAKLEKVDPLRIQSEVNKSIDEHLKVVEKAGRLF